MKPRKELCGTIIGRLLVMGWERNTAGKIVWNCVCECGNTKQVKATNLPKLKSCGCLNHSWSIHGMVGTPEYRAWKHLRGRCNTPTDNKYLDYGGRGIKVCERWNTFAHFLADMGLRPSPHHSVERKDVNGDYCPDNCIWADAKTQSNNRRKSIRLTYQGKTQTLAQWSDEYGIKRMTAWYRYKKGYPMERILKT